MQFFQTSAFFDVSNFRKKKQASQNGGIPWFFKFLNKIIKPYKILFYKLWSYIESKQELEPENDEEAGALEPSGADETYATCQAHA